MLVTHELHIDEYAHRVIHIKDGMTERDGRNCVFLFVRTRCGRTLILRGERFNPAFASALHSLQRWITVLCNIPASRVAVSAAKSTAPHA